MKRKLIYILSPSFSGSTLLTLLMAQHAELATIGELKATAMGDTENYYCSCGSLISDCNFWLALKEKLSQQGVDFSFDDFGTHFASERSLIGKVMTAQVRNKAFEFLRGVTLNAPSISGEYKRIMERNKLFIDYICELQHADVFLDGSKDPQRLMYYLQSGAFDVHVIYMFRDGRAQSNSRRQKPRRPVDYSGAVDEWVSTINQMKKVVAMMPADKVFSFRYEDLCSAPKKVLDHIWQFVGLEPIDMQWEDIDLKQTPHHILGNSMRTKKSIQLRLDVKWKDQVSDEELTYFENKAGALNRSLGYLD